jgi:putative flavoprotein involved in K+ transport
MHAAMPILAPGRGLSLQTLARAGVTLAGRPIAVDGERVAFDGSVAANVAAGDAFAARIRTMVDELIRRQGLDTPPAEPAEPDAPVDLDPPSSLDLHADEVASVVWCTGFSGDFSWLDPALVDTDGHPATRTAPPRPRPASGTSGCAGSSAAAPASFLASPTTPGSSPTRSGAIIGRQR